MVTSIANLQLQFHVPYTGTSDKLGQGDTRRYVYAKLSFMQWSFSVM